MEHEAIFAAAKAAATEACKAEVAKWNARGLCPERDGGLNCGFGWVEVRPATSPFIRWCRKQSQGGTRREYGDRHWKSGWEFWNPGDYGGQAVDVKYAGAQAFARVLNEAGIRASACSRLD